MKKLSFLKSSATRILSHVDIIHPDVGAQHDFPAAENIEGNQKDFVGLLKYCHAPVPLHLFPFEKFPNVARATDAMGCVSTDDLSTRAKIAEAGNCRKI